jgi:hypothetical protein
MATLNPLCLHGNSSFLPYSFPVLPFVHHTVISLSLPFSIIFTLKQLPSIRCQLKIIHKTLPYVLSAVR